MKTITLRAGEPVRDFQQIAEWFSTIEDEPTTESKLKEYYEKEKRRIVQKVAKEHPGDLIGFYWMVDDRIVKGRAFFDLFIRPESRGQKTGKLLYDDLAAIAKQAGVINLRVNVSDIDRFSLTFAEERGFKEVRHQFPMCLELESFDDRLYDPIISGLKDQGFVFTCMAEVGDVEENRRKLFTLNDEAAASTPGTNGEHSWDSFEDFDKRVCQADWYKPMGQMVVIDTTNGKWVAMSAITRMDGNQHAYNLFTGVDMAYRGRKLAQAVKVLALRYAREVLKVKQVRTHHNTQNAPMIAIDQKFGYSAMPGTIMFEKHLD